IDHYAFCLSFLRQPDLFLRIRPGYEQTVKARLTEVPHELIPPFTLRLPNGTKIEDLFTPDKEVVVQDYSSQRIAEFIPPAHDFWDACSASGGKSILIHDLIPGMNITVSDIRESILHNLRQRFRQAGINTYHAFIADLTKGLPSGILRNSPDTEKNPARLPYDLVLADVPCTGSGTWSRTPEELYFFDPRKILTYSTAQKQIVSNVTAHLEPGARLVYSTCSVFKKENEAVAALIREKPVMRMELAANIKGSDRGADSMFAARFVSED
ncbi:MAG TPA: hypothetical protein VHC48_02120, partial [Puia sp.]|nr:hypothetical protein [Puia sp.]